MPQLSIHLKRLHVKSLHHEHNIKLELKVGRFSISVRDVSVVELAPSQHEDDFLQLNYGKIVS